MLYDVHYYFIKVIIDKNTKFIYIIHIKNIQ